MASRRRTRIVRIARWLGIIAAAALVLQNLLLNLALPARLSDEERTVTWELAWMIVPGKVHVRGFRLADRTDNHLWWLELDRVSAWVSLSALAGRELIVASAEASGARFSIEASPEPRADEEEPQDTSDMWRFELRWVDVEPVESICIMGVCTEGAGRLRGGFELAPLQHFQVGPASFDAHGATVTMADGIVGEDVQGRVEVTIHRVDISKTDGLEHFEHVDAEARLRVQLPTLRGLLAHMPERGRPNAGRGRAELNASVRKGIIAPTSVLRGEVAGAAFRVGEHRAWLAGRIGGAVRDESVTLRLSRGRVTARAAEAEQMQLEIGEVSAKLSGLSANLARPSVTPRVEVEARDGTLSDARLVSPWLPSSLVPQQGTGTLSGRGRWRPDTGELDASLELRADDWRWRLGSMDVRSGLRIDGAFQMTTGGSLSLSGSTVELADLAIEGSEEDVTDWSGRVTVQEALERKGVRLAHGLHLRMRDARPMLAVLEATADPPDLLQRVAEMQSMEGRMNLIVPSEGPVGLEDVALSGDGLDVEGWLRFGDPTEYSLYFDAGLLSLGVVSRGGERTFHPLGVGM